MSDNKKFAEQLAAARPVTRHLVTSILLDQWPNNEAVVDFGIHSQEHYESLYYPIRNREISPAALDAAAGDGQKLTALTREAPSNSHKDVEFYTAQDMVMGRENQWEAGWEAFLRTLEERAAVPGRDKEPGHER